MSHRHYSIDIPPAFCEECGKDWTVVVDGREGRRLRRAGQGPRQVRAVRYNRLVAAIRDLPVLPTGPDGFGWPYTEYVNREAVLTLLEKHR